MNGYQYLIARNCLMQKLEAELAKIEAMPDAEKEAEKRRLQAQFDVQLRELYAQMAAEYPGERKKKARPLDYPN